MRKTHANVTSRVRRARKMRLCDAYPGRPIRPGELYVEHTEYPGGESGYADSAGHPVRMAECRDCAEQCGRGYLFVAYLYAERQREAPASDPT